MGIDVNTWKTQQTNTHHNQKIFDTKWQISKFLLNICRSSRKFLTILGPQRLHDSFLANQITHLHSPRIGQGTCNCVTVGEKQSSLQLFHRDQETFSLWNHENGTNSRTRWFLSSERDSLKIILTADPKR